MDIKKIIKEEVENLLSENVTLKSKSNKGNKVFKQLKTAQFQHYDMPKGKLSNFTKGEEDRKRLRSKLSKADKALYDKWIKTPEGQESVDLFKSKESGPHLA